MTLREGTGRAVRNRAQKTAGGPEARGGGTQPAPPKAVEAVGRALKILGSFTVHDGALTLAELSARTGLYKSTLLRLAATLEAGGFLLRLPDKTFVLGSELLRLGAAYRSSFRLEPHVRPMLRRLIAETGESATFFRREGDRRICLFRENSSKSIRDHIAEGDSHGLDIGASAHVLCRFDPCRNSEAAIRRGFPDLPLVSLGERDVDTAATAVPIFSAEGAAPVLVGALSLSGPRSRFTPDAVATMRQALMDAGRDLSTMLGGGAFWRSLQSADAGRDGGRYRD